VRRLRGGVIVSCQAGSDDVLHGPAAMRAMAEAAARGGARGIRANGTADIAAIRAGVSLPIIGIDKQEWHGRGIRITPTWEAAEAIAAAGADIIALDATMRAADDGRMPTADLIAAIHNRLGLPVMADVATFEEGIAAAQAGADLVATTLSGYTAYSPTATAPDFDLLARLAHALAAFGVPVIAEGRISTPEQAAHVFQLGGYAVVVGSMITRPRYITQAYVEAVAAHTEAASHPVIAVDVGGSKIAAAIFEAPPPEAADRLLPHIVGTVVEPTHADEGGPAVAARIARIIAQLRAGYDAAAHAGGRPPVAAVGIGTSGEVGEAGRITYATGFMPGWQGVPLRAILEAETGLPVVVENDGTSAALGEALYGAGRGHLSVLAVTVGTGIGGGFALAGQPYRGAHRAAVTLGHLPLVRDGAACTCGRRGCLEAYASGTALLSDYRIRAAQPRADGAALAEAVARGDAHALAALDAHAGWLAQGLATAANLLDPAVIALGGGVAALGEPWLTRVRAAFAHFAYATTAHTPIVAAALPGESVLWGAAALAHARR
jgi:putative N-acetylmannosamine-6-phosphate epimerase/predicted NBD/HSP70 family sugar kinase